MYGPIKDVHVQHQFFYWSPCVWFNCPWIAKGRGGASPFHYEIIVENWYCRSMNLTPCSRPPYYGTWFQFPSMNGESHTPFLKLQWEMSRLLVQVICVRPSNFFLGCDPHGHRGEGVTTHSEIRAWEWTYCLISKWGESLLILKYYCEALMVGPSTSLRFTPCKQK